VRGGALESPSSSPSPTKTRPWEVPRARESQIRKRGTTPRAPGMGRPLRPRRQFPVWHLCRTGSPTSKSSNALRKTHLSPSSTAPKITIMPSTTSAKPARTSRSPGSPSTTPGVLLSLASNAT
jgi:hypothetical protein